MAASGVEFADGPGAAKSRLRTRAFCYICATDDGMSRRRHAVEMAIASRPGSEKILMLAAIGALP